MIESLWKTLCFSSSYPHLPNNPRIPLLGIYPREMKLHSHKDLYSNIHSNIILNSPTVNNQKSPSIGDWINKLWSIMDATQQQKRMNPQTPNQHVEESQRYYAKAESRGESFILYDVFHLHKILQKMKSISLLTRCQA